MKNRNDLPSLPLQGNVKKLVEELMNTFSQPLFPSYWKTKSIPTKPPATFLELVNLLDILLDNDQFISCKLKQKGTHSVEVLCSDQLQWVHSVLDKVVFDKVDRSFVEWTKCKSFLDHVTGTSHDEDAQGKKSEEANAIRTIAKLFHGSLDPVLVAVAMISFRHLKASLRRFFRIIYDRIKQKRSVGKQIGDDNINSDVLSGKACRIFRDIPNLLQDKRQFSTRKDEITQALQANTVVDSLECTCCGISLTPCLDYPAKRFQDFCNGGRSMSFQMFAQQFNNSQFRNALGNHVDGGEAFTYHTRSPQHVDNYHSFFQGLENVCTVITRLLMSKELLCNMIQGCRNEAQLDSSNLTSWYLSSAEVAETLLTEIRNISDCLQRKVNEWSVYPLGQLYPLEVYPQAYELPDQVESFYKQKVLEEEDLIANTEETNISNSNDTSTSNQNPIVELIRGPYLDPNANEFVPWYT